MSEPAKSNSRLRRRAFLIWFFSFAVIASLLTSTEANAARWTATSSRYWVLVLLSAGGALLPVGLWLCLRWSPCSWRNVRRVMVGLALFATLVAVFYTEENWRGKRAWENCKRELQAKGAGLDWNKLIPSHVPDDQNFFTVNTNFYLRFVKLRDAEQTAAAKESAWLQLSLTSSNAFPVLDFAKSKPVIVAELTAISAPLNVAATNRNAPVIQLRDAEARQQLAEIFRKTIGRSANGAQGFKFSELQLSNLVPARVFIQADTLLTKDDFKNLVTNDLATNFGQLGVEPTAAPGIFQVRLVSGQITSAAEYLQWSDQYAAAFDDLRAALKRPYAIIPGDYSMPYAMPIPNFVLLRSLSQILAQRTQCYLLLDEPDQALRELTLMHDVCRILRKPPTGQPETLVEAMINVAITGLYNASVADGFRWQTWREPQMIALQEQLKSVNLYTPVVNGFKMEQSASAQTLLNCPAPKLFDLFNLSEGSNGKTGSHFWTQSPAFWFLALAPRGWLYQNVVVATRLEQYSLDAFETKTSRVEPRVFEHGMNEVEKTFKHSSPFHFWAAIAVSNFAKAAQTMAYQQTLANEGQVVCALERFKLANQSYPATLDELVPRYMEAIPSDLIGGQPLHYRQIDNEKFLLYSVGWNETDDGGTPGDLHDPEKGDWVWQYPVK